MSARKSSSSSGSPSSHEGRLLLEHGERGATAAGTGELHAAMRIRVSDPALTSDLLDYLDREGCLAIQMGANMVAVSLSDGLPYDAARLELDLHLTDWLISHADARAFVVD